MRSTNIIVSVIGSHPLTLWIGFESVWKLGFKPSALTVVGRSCTACILAASLTSVLYAHAMVPFAFRVRLVR